MDKNIDEEIVVNFNSVENRIEKVCDIFGRKEAPDLVAVSKKQPNERVHAALKLGHRIFGENRVQEAQHRWQPLRDKYPDLRLHLIGGLQTNKASDAVAVFDVIEVVDRPKLARALADEMTKQNRRLPCYIQVNTGEEDQKSGVLPVDLKELFGLCHTELGLDVIGLMCIPPIDEEPAMHFALLRELAKRNGLKMLSMGMSDDFEDAVAFGATSVRVGSALFGAR